MIGDAPITSYFIQRRAGGNTSYGFGKQIEVSREKALVREDALETLVEKEKRGSEVQVGDTMDTRGGGSSGCDSGWICDNCDTKHLSSVLMVCTECKFVRLKEPPLPMKGINEHHLYLHGKT